MGLLLRWSRLVVRVPLGTGVLYMYLTVTMHRVLVGRAVAGVLLTLVISLLVHVVVRGWTRRR
jgi:hypothetical protein